MTAISRKPNRRTPSLPYVSGDVKNHTDLLTTIRNTLEIGQRRTADFKNSFVSVQDLIDLGIIDENGNFILVVPEDDDDDGGGGGGGDGTDDAVRAATILTVNNEIATLANSRRVLPGTNITFDDSVSGVRTINASTVGVGSATALAAAILADSPIGYWKCDEASGSVNDYGSANVDLAGGGTITYQSAPLIPGDSTNYARLASGAGFTATSGLGLSFPLTGSFTIEALVRPINNSGALSVFGIGGNGETEALNFQCRLNISSGDWQTFWESGAGTDRIATGYGLNAPQRYHVAAVKNAGSSLVLFYLNGVLINSVAMPTNATGGTGTMITAIGASAAGASTAEFLVGHVAFYNSALSAARLLAHANAAGF